MTLKESTGDNSVRIEELAQSNPETKQHHPEGSLKNIENAAGYLPQAPGVNRSAGQSEKAELKPTNERVASHTVLQEPPAGTIMGTRTEVGPNLLTMDHARVKQLTPAINTVNGVQPAQPPPQEVQVRAVAKREREREREREGEGEGEG